MNLAKYLVISIIAIATSVMAEATPTPEPPTTAEQTRIEEFIEFLRNNKSNKGIRDILLQYLISSKMPFESIVFGGTSILPSVVAKIYFTTCIPFDAEKIAVTLGPPKSLTLFTTDLAIEITDRNDIATILNKKSQPVGGARYSINEEKTAYLHIHSSSCSYGVSIESTKP